MVAGQQGTPAWVGCTQPTPQLGVAIWVATRRHDSKTTRISRVRVGKNSFGSSSGQARVHFGSLFRVNFGSIFVSRVHFGSISCQFRVNFRVACPFRVNFVSRVKFVSRVQFVSCRVKPLRVRVAVSCRFRVTGRVRVGEEKIRHGSNTTQIRHVTRIVTPTRSQPSRDCKCSHDNSHGLGYWEP
ncbi:hypothetical protein TIFTF001_040546 [Ficus carica]|uniref:Uncharacterized protein n=1 Tax=Ficus carica TaxID=3494 RepID=A0AA87ZDG7_FICCA|nr:hypothetical protein TIFTF001_040546 [Ficus carica]